MAEGWTTAQAAFVMDEPLEVFKKGVERGPVRARIVRVGNMRVRKFDLSALVFLHAQRELNADLTPKGRSELYEALIKLPHHGASREVTFGNLKFDFGRHLEAVELKLKELESLRGEVDASSGEALIKGTTIKAFRIAALLDGGMTVASVLLDYPSLNERQVLAARAYAEVNPKVGRPFPKTTAKTAMRATGLDALDDGD